jgi:hypothetical protein
MNYFKELYKDEIAKITGWQREAGYCEWKINAYLADMEDWVNSFHRQHPDGEKFSIGAGLAQDNSRFDLPAHLEIVGFQGRYDKTVGWVPYRIADKALLLEHGYEIREVYAFKD